MAAGRGTLTMQRLAVRLIEQRDPHDAMRIVSRDEQHAIARARMLPPTFFVQAYEVIYNVAGFAATPDEERWNAIWSMWVTPRRNTYRALVDSQILPHTIQFREIQWSAVLGATFVYRLYLERVPPRRPRTQEQHFDEERR